MIEKKHAKEQMKTKAQKTKIKLRYGEKELKSEG